MAKTKKQSRSSVPSVNHEDAFGDLLFGWYAPEYLRFERGLKWYLLAALVDALLVFYAFWTGSWSMALVFLVLPVVYLLEHRRHPNLIRVEVSSWGIRFGQIQMPFTEIKRFWIHHQPPLVDELRLETSNRLHPEVIIPLMGANPALIRQYLVTQVPEWEGKSVPVMDLVTRFLRLH